ADGAAVVTSFTDDDGERDRLQERSHLVDDRSKSVVQDLEGDRVDLDRGSLVKPGAPTCGGHYPPYRLMSSPAGGLPTTSCSWPATERLAKSSSRTIVAPGAALVTRRTRSATLMIRFPPASTRAKQPGGKTVVVSGCSTRAGPSMRSRSVSDP